MFIFVMSEGFPQVIPIKNIALVTEQPENNNAIIYLEKPISLSEDVSMNSIHVDHTVSEVHSKIWSCYK